MARAAVTDVTGILFDRRSPSLGDRAGRTPLHVACAAGDLAAAALLLEQGASVLQAPPLPPHPPLPQHGTPEFGQHLTG